MKQFIIFSMLITWVVTLAAQQNGTILSPSSEKLFIKHVNLLTQETKIWEVKSDLEDFPESNFISGSDGLITNQSNNINEFKSLDLIEKITKNPQHPERAILFCNNTLENKLTSAVMIAPRHILACGKPYYSAEQTPGKIFLSSFDYLKKLDSYEFAYATDIYYFSKNPNDFQNDLAVITLDRPLGAAVGWMGYGYNTNNNYYKENSFSITDLDYYSQNAYELHKYAAKADMVQENAFYFAPYKSLTPGAPLYSSNKAVHGIVSHWARTYGDIGDTTYYDGVTRITPTKFNTISSIIKEDTPTEPDVMPLKISVTPHKIEALKQLEELSYRLFNGSSATFEGSVKLDFYLSSDNIINSKDIKITSLGGDITMAPNYFVTSNTTKDLTIPLNIKPGKYYVGAILTLADYNIDNNTTRGVDCDTLLVENLLANNYISGKIITSGEYSGEGYCLLMQYNGNKLGRLYDIVEVDENLNFKFEKVFLGKYIIVYVPSKSNNIHTPPTYFNQTPYWQNATVLELGLSDTLRNININRIELPPLNGNKTISGHLSIQKTKSAYDENKDFFGDISIIVENPQDKSIFGFCYPDSTGFYQLKNLTVGSYDIVIDKPGFTLVNKHTISLTSEMEGIGDLNFVFNPDSTISATNITKAPLYLENTSLIIYPILNNGQFTLKLGRDNIGDNEISIINVNGDVILRTFVRNPSEVSKQFGLEVPSGIYFIRIKNSRTTVTKKIIVM